MGYVQTSFFEGITEAPVSEATQDSDTNVVESAIVSAYQLPMFIKSEGGELIPAFVYDERTEQMVVNPLLLVEA